MIRRLLETLRQRFGLAPDDLLRDAVFRRLWSSILISSLGGQITMLALPLTAVVLLQATPTQMGTLVAMEIAPFVLLSLPSGVWLDRVRKLPVYIAGEAALGLIVASVPLAWVLGWLSMPWMYAVGFVMGCVYVVAVQQHAATFFAETEDAAGADLPQFVKDEFDAFLECGILAHGFLRLRCGDCGHDKLVAFSCKRRGFCPSCGARRRRRRTWSTTSSRTCRCGSGCCHCPSRCACCWQHSPSW